MPRFDPRYLAAFSQGIWLNGLPGQEITGFGIDSRKAGPGEVFVALRGNDRDGHDYLNAAHAAGAAAAIVERRIGSCNLPQLLVKDSGEALRAIASAHRRSFKGKVIGITGSNGKTTTKDLLERFFSGAGSVATQGNFNNTLGVPLSLLRIDLSVHHYAVIEAGINQPGEMAVLASLLQPEGAIVTSVGPAHLELLKTIERIAQEKAALPHATKAGGWVLHPEVLSQHKPFQSFASRRHVLLQPQTGDWPPPDSGSSRLTDPRERIAFQIEFRPDPASTLLHLRVKGAEVETYFARPLTRGLSTCLALALTAARLEGIEPDFLQDQLGSWLGSHSRAQIARRNKVWLYWDAYNANPASMADALEGFVSYGPAEAPRFYLLGSMGELGERADYYHFQIGQSIVLRPQDTLVLLGAHAEAYEEGIRSRFDETKGQIYREPAGGKLLDLLHKFSGNLFVKGSRSQRLERFVPAPDASELILFEPRKANPC
jgi:UDP-N-acetylmuramoyl-tripeptide--D-alanyl-D-alanine ligase